jgi:hypothetical protein
MILPAMLQLAYKPEIYNFVSYKKYDKKRSFLVHFNAIRLVLRRIVGWVEALRNPTTRPNVGFRSSTQPTQFKVFCANTKRIAF